MKKARSQFYTDRYTDLISSNSDDQGKLFKASKSDLTFPDYRDPRALANDIGEYFIRKIECVRSELASTSGKKNFAAMDVSTSTTPFPANTLGTFSALSEQDIQELILKCNKKSCSLDPMPTSLLINCLDVLLLVITRTINLSLESDVFPDRWKWADVHPRS